MLRKNTLFAVIAVMSSGCLWNNQGATDAYVRQVTTASMRVAQLEASVAEAESRLGQVEDTIRRQGEEKVTQLETMEDVNGEMRRIRGEIELLRRDIDVLKGSFDRTQLTAEKRQLHAERRLGQIEEMFGLIPPAPPTDEELGITMAEPPSEGVVDGEPLEGGDTTEPVVEGSPFDSVAEPTPEPTAGLGTAEDYLEKAVQLMQDGSNKGARKLLEAAAKKFEGSPDMSEIRYRIAETHFNDGEFAKSITRFQEVVDSWPKSEWAPWAVLRQGDAFRELDQRDNARLFYEEVQRVYPGSEAAKEAKKLLSR